MLGRFIQENQQAWEQRYANYQQVVGAFSGASGAGNGNDVLLAAGPGYSGLGGDSSDREAHIARMMNWANQESINNTAGPPAGNMDMAPTKANAIRLGLMSPDGQTDGTWASPVTQDQVVGYPLPPLGTAGGLKSPGALGYVGGAAEMLLGGTYNQGVRIVGGLASLPYAIFDGPDAAVAIQDATRANLGYTLQSDGARAIVGHLAPVVSYVQDNVINPTRTVSEKYLGDGVTTVLGASLQAGTEIYGTTIGIRAVGNFATVALENAFSGPLSGSRAAQFGAINLSSPRYQPGVVTFGDDLVPASGNWLSAATPAPIPLQVARALEGQSFKTFPELQSAVWRTIGNDAELSAGFGEQALGQMSIGNAPFAPRAFQNSQFGGRFNLHHVDPIGTGGAVYDLSNLRIVSPRVHTEIHYP